MRMIFLPALDRHVPLSAYIQAVKLAKANPDKTFKHGLTTWWPTTGREIAGQFFEGVQDRINQAETYSRRGRKKEKTNKVYKEISKNHFFLLTGKLCLC